MTGEGLLQIVLFLGVVLLLVKPLGAYMARREGLRIWIDVQEKLKQGAMPGNEMIEGLLILVAGAFLLTPGFMTDAAGFALLVPPVRKLARESLKKRFAGRIEVATPYNEHPPDWRDTP